MLATLKLSAAKQGEQSEFMNVKIFSYHRVTQKMCVSVLGLKTVLEVRFYFFKMWFGFRIFILFHLNT